VGTQHDRVAAEVGVVKELKKKNVLGEVENDIIMSEIHSGATE